MVSSVQDGEIVWCLLSTVAKLSGVYCPRWQKNMVSFVYPGKIAWCLLGLVSFGSGVFCPTFSCYTTLVFCSGYSSLELMHSFDDVYFEEMLCD